MIFGGVWMLVFWGAIIGLVVWAIMRVTKRGDGRSGNSKEASALDIARERYARGEISRDEFEQLKKDLSSQ